LSKKRKSSKTHTKSIKATRKFSWQLVKRSGPRQKRKNPTGRKKDPHCRVSWRIRIYGSFLVLGTLYVRVLLGAAGAGAA
jgi:hypothetical protein